jgi:diguanylate cyclase (GGDEF)-like protein
MGAFRDANRELRMDLEEERTAKERRADQVTVALIILLSAVFAVTAFFTVERRARDQQRRDGGRTRFTEALQLARSEPEAYRIVRRHLELLVPGSRATVLNRNNSANRLEARTAVEDPALASALEGAEPEACIAIRGGKTYRRSGSQDELIGCEICGLVGKNVTCVPSLVGGEVIGSVLLELPRALVTADDEAIATSLVTAAPIVANMRTLAIAETRAATDSLTGLPNKRAVHETLNRLVAQAGRTTTPLAMVVFDLDHFKQINDTFGHAKGDEVLAAVGDVVANTLRGSDFVGRYGGEEFLALLPDTGSEGAIVLAEKLRETIGQLRVSGIERPITASFGVAVMPDEAGDPESLLRVADRALYTAKANGRNRVEVAVKSPAGEAAPA